MSHALPPRPKAAAALALAATTPWAAAAAPGKDEARRVEAPGQRLSILERINRRSSPA
jgi:hypothetical protein